MTTNVFHKKINRLIGCGGLSANEFLFGVTATVFFGLTFCWLVAVQASPNYLLPRPLIGVVLYLLGVIIIKCCQWLTIRVAGYFVLSAATGYLLAPAIGDGIGGLIPDTIYLAMQSSFLVMLFALAWPKPLRHYLAPIATALISVVLAGLMMLTLDLALPSVFSWVVAIIFIWHVAENLRRATKVAREFGNVIDVAAEIFLQPFAWLVGLLKKRGWL